MVSALVSLAFASTAGATTVHFSYTDEGGEVAGTGIFSGTDANNDGLLSLTELSSFISDDATLSGLFDFGTYNIATNTWNADASGWGQTDFAWYSWDDGDMSINPVNASMATVVEQSEVPEPGSLALLGLGLAGFAVTSRKRQA